MSGPFLRNPYLLVLTIAIILVAGLSAFASLPRLEDPRITNRFPVVRTAFPGASAELVEALVTEPLEDALDEIEEIKNIESTSRAGFSSVGVELKDSVTEDNSEEVISKVRSKIREASVQLPQGRRRGPGRGTRTNRSPSRASTPSCGKATLRRRSP